MEKTTPEAIRTALEALSQKFEAMAAELKSLPEKLATLGQGGTSVQAAQTDQVLKRLDEIGVHPGLCANKDCVPCRQAAKSVVEAANRQSRTALFSDLDKAVTWAGKVAEADAVFDALEAWNKAGRPEPKAAEEKKPEVESGIPV